MIIFCIPCLTLILYFLILSLFIPRYRILIKEAWLCFVDKLHGRKCSVSFDNKMHKAFVLWLAKRNHLKAARFFQKKRNFDIFLASTLIIFTIVTTWLFLLLIKFLFIEPPCPSTGDGGVCTGLD